MKLRDAIAQLKNLESGWMLFAAKPWTLDCEAEIRPFVVGLGVPQDLRTKGFDYFIDSGTAHEVLEALGEYVPTNQEVEELIIHYAVNDAFPEWLAEIQRQTR